MPQFVKDEVDTYLKCGILAHGFLRLRCADCAHEKLVAFSCKRRGFCPSCGARRMAETAAHLVERIIPRVPVRQWFLSFPNALRALLAAHPQRVSEDLQIVHRVFATFLIKQAGLKRTDAHTGAVTLIQRFGSAANLNLHLHCLVLDGVYRLTEGEPVFQSACAPTAEQLHGLLDKIIVRVMRLLTRRGLLIEEHGEQTFAAIEADPALSPLQWASCTYRIALGPRAGQKLLTLQTLSTQTEPVSPGLCAKAHGFSLHAGLRCAAHQRQELEQLCRYITRPAIANARLGRSRTGQVVLRLKTPYTDGTTHVVMSPLQFLQPGGKTGPLLPV